ncbi:MAG: CBS domain-containing protein, partial [Methanobacterium sp.]
PTIEAYHTLNISAIDKEALVPIFKKGKRVGDLSVAKIEFTSIPHPGECEAAIKVVGNIKQLDLGDRIKVGPTPVNKLIVNGMVVGRDDVDNLLLLDTTNIRSIPKKSVIEVASHNLITLKPSMNVKDAATVLSENKIEGAPIIEDEEVVGILTLSDISKAIAEGKENLKITELMSKNIITVEKDLMIADAIEVMNKNKIGRLIVVDNDNLPLGIVTRTDLLDKIAGIK